MKAPHLQIGRDQNATEPKPLVTNPMKLSPVHIRLHLKGQSRLITNEQLPREWQNVFRIHLRELGAKKVGGAL